MWALGVGRSGRIDGVPHSFVGRGAPGPSPEDVSVSAERCALVEVNRVLATLARDRVGGAAVQVVQGR